MFGMRELIAYLEQFEISPRRAMEVFSVFGPSAMQAISQNPYLLCGEPLQLDFRHADRIAQYYHMEGDCTQRLEAALLRTLRHNAGKMCIRDRPDCLRQQGPTPADTCFGKLPSAA